MTDLVPDLSLDRDKFDGPGHCIYCQRCGPDIVLTDEHIYPYFMGGNVELLRSSCLKCNDIIHRIEGYCANRIMNGFRHHYNIHSRSKSRPITVPVRFTNNGRFDVRDVPFDEAPQILLLPEFEEPGILIDAPPSGIVVPKTMWLWTTDDFMTRAEKLRKPGDEAWTVIAGGDYGKLCRFIAKTALGSAVALLGYDSAKSPLTKIVLGEDKNVRHLIGGGHHPGVGPQIHFSAAVTTDSFAIGFQKLKRQGYPDLLSAELTFYRKHGSPTYIAIVGPAPTPELETIIRAPRKLNERKLDRNRDPAQ